jgi:hypothetical protein
LSAVESGNGLRRRWPCSLGKPVNENGNAQQRQNREGLEVPDTCLG